MTAQFAMPERWHGSEIEEDVRARVGTAGRKQLETWGRDDGVALIPDPSANTIRSTPRRTELAREALARQAHAKLAFTRRREDLAQQRLELMHSIEAWLNELTGITKDRDEIQQSVTAADGKPLRRSSETNRTEEFVAYRRSRGVRQELQELKRRRRDLRKNIDEANHILGRLQAAIAATAEQSQAFVAWITEQYRLAISIYDTALLRHHPARDLIQPLDVLLTEPVVVAAEPRDEETVPDTPEELLTAGGVGQE